MGLRLLQPVRLQRGLPWVDVRVQRQQSRPVLAQIVGPSRNRVDVRPRCHQRKLALSAPTPAPALRSDPCGASDHKNSNGNNLRQGADVDKYYDCCSQCDYNEGCRGWTFVYNGNNQGQCWLKSWVPPGTEWTYDPDVISGGVPPPREL